MKNNWVTQLLKPFALWELSLPCLSSPLDLEKVFAFTDAFEALGRTYEIFEILETRETNIAGRFIKNEHNKYSDHIKEASKQAKRLSFFDFGLDVPLTKTGTKTRYPGKICYFTKTEITHKRVDDVGVLLGSLIEEEEVLDMFEEDTYKHLKPYYIRSVAPVTLTGNAPWMPIDSNEYRSIPNIGIQLFTDIWFPWVVGYFSDRKARKQSELFDNRQLSQYHTTRLNHFLADAKKLTLEYGGTWECIKGENELQESMYIDMIYETGINLQWEKDKQEGDNAG